MKAKELLKKIEACKEAIDWVCDKTLQESWETCHRGDWMLWLYAKLYPENLKELTIAKGHCANTVRHLMTDQRSLDAVDAAIAFGEGKISKQELYAAAYDSYLASSSYDAAAAAAAACDAAAAAYYAAYSVVNSTPYYANSSYDYAAFRAYCVAAYDIAKKQNQQQTADICRKYLELK